MSARYGCHDRPDFRARIVVQDGWFMDGYTRTPRMVMVPQAMAKDCRYTHTGLGRSDARCTGCKWRAP